MYSICTGGYMKFTNYTQIVILQFNVQYKYGISLPLSFLSGHTY